jgi:hypothetical protein
VREGEGGRSATDELGDGSDALTIHDFSMFP